MQAQETISESIHFRREVNIITQQIYQTLESKNFQTLLWNKQEAKLRLKVVYFDNYLIILKT